MKTSEIQIGETYAFAPRKNFSAEAATVVALDVPSAFEAISAEDRVAVERIRRMSQKSETILVSVTSRFSGTASYRFVSARQLVEPWADYHAREEMMNEHRAKMAASQRRVREAWEQEKVVVVETLREHGVDGFIDVNSIHADLSGTPSVTLTRRQVLALVDHLANR